MATETKIVHRENDFAVLRYIDEAEMHERVHKHTHGRFPNRIEAELARVDRPNAHLLRVEERHEEWDEEVECT